MSQTAALKDGMSCQSSVGAVYKVLGKSEVLSFRRRPRKSNNPCRAWTNSIQDEFGSWPLNLIEKKVPFTISWGNRGKRMIRREKNKTNISLPNLNHHQHHNQEPFLKEKLRPSKKSSEEPHSEVKTSGKRKLKITFEKKVVVAIDVNDHDQVMSQKTTDACPYSSEQQQRELPLGFKNYIKELGATGDPVLVIEKRLFASDVNRGLQRLLIPVKQVINHGFLTEEERSRLNSEDKKEGVDAILIEPSLAQSGIKLKKWHMGTSESYVLVRGWNNVVNRNGLKAGRIVQLWSFKKGLQLYFVLVQVL